MILKEVEYALAAIANAEAEGMTTKQLLEVVRYAKTCKAMDDGVNIYVQMMTNERK
jgi:hypothetical protein